MSEEIKKTYAGLSGYEGSFTAGDTQGRFWIANRGREVFTIFCVSLPGAKQPLDEIVLPSFKLN